MTDTTIIENLVTTNATTIDHAMTNNATADDWKRISENIEEQLKIVRGERMVSEKRDDYYACTRCDINSLTKDRMCPCPRGGCEAKLVGSIDTITILNQQHLGKVGEEV